jgi:hypothetical protein
MLSSCYEEMWPLGYKPFGVKSRRYVLSITDDDKSNYSSFTREDSYNDNTVNIKVFSVSIKNSKIISGDYIGTVSCRTGVISWFRKSKLSNHPVFLWSPINDFVIKNKTSINQKEKKQQSSFSTRNPSSSQVLFNMENSGDWPLLR